MFTYFVDDLGDAVLQNFLDKALENQHLPAAVLLLDLLGDLD